MRDQGGPRCRGGPRGGSLVPCRASCSTTATSRTSAASRSPPSAATTARCGAGRRSRRARSAATRSGGRSRRRRGRGARAPAVLRGRARHSDAGRRGRDPVSHCNPANACRPRRHARARRRLRRRVRRPPARPPRRDDRQPGELHALHAAAARGGGRQRRAAPRHRAAAHDVPARRPRARLGRRPSTPSAASSRSSPRPARSPSRYDELVVALGSVTRMPAVPGLREHALGLKDLARRDPPAQPRPAPDRARRRRARAAPSARLTFVFAGAGFAGVEVDRRAAGAGDRRAAPPPAAGAASSRAGCSSTPRRAHPRPEPGAASPRFAARTLGRRGIEILTGTSLAAVDAAGVDALGRPPRSRRHRRLDGGRRAPTRSLARARAAVRRARPRAGRRDAARRRLPDVWALGDCAAVPERRRRRASSTRPTCQHALRQARRLARNLRGAPQPYRYRTRGQMATLGRRHGIAVVGRVPVRGVLGWAIARGYHLAPAAVRLAARARRWPTGPPPRCSAATSPNCPARRSR